MPEFGFREENAADIHKSKKQFRLDVRRAINADLVKQAESRAARQNAIEQAKLDSDDGLFRKSVATRKKQLAERQKAQEAAVKGQKPAEGSPGTPINLGETQVRPDNPEPNITQFGETFGAAGAAGGAAAQRVGQPAGGGPNVSVDGQAFAAPPTITTQESTQRGARGQVFPAGAPGTAGAQVRPIAQPNILQTRERQNALTPGQVLQARIQQQRNQALQANSNRTFQAQQRRALVTTFKDFMGLTGGDPEASANLALGAINNDPEKFHKGLESGEEAFAAVKKQADERYDLARRGAEALIAQRLAAAGSSKAAAAKSIATTSGATVSNLDILGYPAGKEQLTPNQRATQWGKLFGADGLKDPGLLPTARNLQTQFLNDDLVVVMPVEEPLFTIRGRDVGGGVGEPEQFPLEDVFNAMTIVSTPQQRKPGNVTKSAEFLKDTGLFDAKGNIASDVADQNSSLAKDVRSLYEKKRAYDQSIGKRATLRDWRAVIAAGRQ